MALVAWEGDTLDVIFKPVPVVFFFLASQLPVVCDLNLANFPDSLKLARVKYDSGTSAEMTELSQPLDSTFHCYFGTTVDVYIFILICAVFLYFFTGINSLQKDKKNCAHIFCRNIYFWFPLYDIISLRKALDLYKSPRGYN